MQIEYKVKRTDLAKAYFYNLRHSPRTGLIIFGVACVLAALNLYQRYQKAGEITPVSVVAAVGWGVGFILVIPVLTMVLAKTQTRKLSLTAEGIETSIGSQQGRIPWKAVESIKAVGEMIIITGKTANTFTIPGSAFIDDEQRKRFIELANEYRTVKKTA